VDYWLRWFFLVGKGSRGVYFLGINYMRLFLNYRSFYIRDSFLAVGVAEIGLFFLFACWLIFFHNRYVLGLFLFGFGNSKSSKIQGEVRSKFLFVYR
jgi:hypothetical protein